MTKIKVCGLMDLQDIDYANEAMPDYVGFVFAPSKRRISSELAWEMNKELNPKIRSVGVFVNETIETIVRIVQEGIISLVQLHGDEDARYIQELRKQIQAPIIKAINMQETGQYSLLTNFDTDYLLLDTGKGGTGQTFDWKLTKHCPTPFFLAGGLNPSNLGEAIRATDPFGVDLSSGLEKDGRKDLSLMKEAVSIAHARNYT
ncbi:phosphoribosylanthranilate isomerase [uncultured Sphaerochaeta sp.]|uniref:phosphoribosylanthranilate isomerase n=1 Tax=uncultured Sphaerochaeta sp. TaxID=886478 RepID=UPI002A0A761D|nr:phosphoribosylanthranilate isomerase [uncultured Sphaerochaeta sp.]